MGLFLTCLSIMLTFFSPNEVVPSLAPYHIQVAIMIFALAVSAPTLTLRPVKGLPSPQWLLMLGLWVAVIASVVTKLKFGWAYDSLKEFGPLLVVYFLVVINAYSIRRLKMVGGVLAVCAVVMAIQAILAYHTGYLGGKLLLYAPDDPIAIFGNRVRGFGILQDPNDFAQFLLVGLALLGFFWKSSRSLFLLAPPAAVLLYATYLTFSRGGLLGIGAVLFFALYRRHRRVSSIAVSGLACLALYAFRFTGGREIAFDNSTAGRLIAWGAGIGATLHHPLFGIGFNRYRDINDLTAHNSFVLCFTELGFFGYFFWLAMLFLTLKGISIIGNLPVKTDEDRAVSGAALALRGAMGAFLVTGWFLSRTYTETLYILLAMGGNLMLLRDYAIPVDLKRIGSWGPRTLMWQAASVVAVYAFIKGRFL